MSDIVVNVTNAGAANVSVSSPSTVNTTVGNGGAVNVSLGTISPGNSTVVSGTLTINATTTLAAGSQAYVKNDAGTAYAAKLDIGIPAGPATNVTVGNTTTLESGNASVTGVADGSNLTLSFAIPRGPAGQHGINGTNGITPTFSIDSVSTLAAGSSANVTLTTSNGGANVALAFGIPRGDPGTGGGSNLTLSDAAPSNLGTASAGTSNLASRADHTHNLPVIAYANLSGVPGNFPSNIASVSGLQAALDGKAAAGNYVTGVNNLTGNLTLAAGSNITITPSGSTLTIAASGGGIGANDPVDGGDYVGELLYGITFTTQPQSQTVSSSTTVNLTARSVSSNTPTQSVFAANGRLYAPRLASQGIAFVSSQDNGTSWQVLSSASAPTSSLSIFDASLVVSNGTRTLCRYSGVLETSGVLNTRFGPLMYSDSADLTSLVAVTGDAADASLVVWNGSRFVAVTRTGDKVLTSPDGEAWTKRLDSSDSSLPFFAKWLSLLGTTAFIGGDSGIIRSSDGISWTSVSISGVFPQSVATSGSRIVGVNGTSVRWSVDGNSWQASTLPVSCDRVSYASGLFWAFRSSVISTGICFSADGVSWTLATAPSSQQWYSAAAAGNVPFFASASGFAQGSVSLTPASANLAVSATATSGNPVSYQWQTSLDAGTSWSNVANATSTTLNLTGLTTADNGTRYRVLASATGAATATSQTAILTVTG